MNGTTCKELLSMLKSLFPFSDLLLKVRSFLHYLIARLIKISLMFLSGHNGGLGIREPVESSTLSFQSSREGSKILSNSIICGTPLDIDLHETQMKTSIHQARKFKDNLEQDIWFDNSNKLPLLRQRTLQRIIKMVNAQLDFQLCPHMTIIFC